MGLESVSLSRCILYIYIHMAILNGITLITLGGHTATAHGQTWEFWRKWSDSRTLRPWLVTCPSWAQAPRPPCAHRQRQRQRLVQRDPKRQKATPHPWLYGRTLPLSIWIPLSFPLPLSPRLRAVRRVHQHRGRGIGIHHPNPDPTKPPRHSSLSGRGVE